MKALIILFVFSMVSIAKADLISQLKAENPNALPYQILQMLYNESSTPATLQDFDWASDANSNQHCALAPAEVVPIIDDYYVVRNYYIQVDAQGAVPGNGPLFPGSPAKPAKIGTEITFDIASAGGKRSDSIRKLSDPRQADISVSFKTTATDLIQTLVPAVGASANEPYILSARKNGNLIAIHVAFGDDDNNPADADDAYIYCYRD